MREDSDEVSEDWDVMREDSEIVRELVTSAWLDSGTTRGHFDTN